MSASARQYMFGRNPRPESAPLGQFRSMQQQQQQQQQFINHQPQQQQFQQQYGQQQQQQQQYGAMSGVNGHYSAGSMNGYGNNMAAGVSPMPSGRMTSQSGMQTSPAVAATAPQHFGPSFCQIPQAQATQQQQQMYTNNNNNPVGQPQLSGCNNNQMTTPQGYLSPSTATAGYPVQTANANNAHMQSVSNYNPNGFNQILPAPSNVPCINNPASPMMSNGQQQGYRVAGHQCGGGHVSAASTYSNPCSPCNGHHHHHHAANVVAPVCNNTPTANNWQCYPAGNVMQPQPQQQQMPIGPQQQQQQHQMAAFQQQQQQPQGVQHNNAWMNNAHMAHGQMNSNNGQQPAMMYNNNMSPMQMQQQQPNGVEAMTNNYAAPNNYLQPCPPPPPYTSNNMPTTAIQCQDVSQSQDFNRTREAAANTAAAASANPSVASGAIPSAAATAAGSPAAPGNMRPETYQRTLEYVQQCQTWTTGDNAKATKENKPPQVGACGQQSGSAAKMTETTAAAAATAATATVTVGRALLSPGQDAVSSSTDRQEAAVAAAAALLPSASNQQANNMVVHDMNTSLNSLMQENRFLQMIQ